MYIIARIPQVDGSVRFVGAPSRSDAREARAAVRQDRAMVDGLSWVAGLEARDCPRGRRPAGWRDV